MKSQRHRGGRPTKLTPEVQKKICDALRLGNFRSVAARYAGVTPDTMALWMARGARARRGIFRAFVDAVEEVEVATEVELVGLQLKSAKVDAKQRRWWLSHRHRKRWADNLSQGKLELTGKGGGPIKIEDARATLSQKLEQLAARKKKPT